MVRPITLQWSVMGHNEKIPIDNIDTNEYIIKSEWNDCIDNTPVTKIKLIPKIIFQSKIKSAKKLTN